VFPALLFVSVTAAIIKHPPLENDAEMCGIAGIWNSGENQNESAARVSTMLRRMSHRGPDGHGGFAFNGGAAGMVRLALVDLSNCGQQPLWSPDRRVAILFNGEIYNFREHRSRLAANGYRFHSKTDTEVILALYLEHGLEFVQRLRGMYAIALFDWRNSTPGGVPELLLVRGPLGVKPLYVVSTGANNQGCAFASELRSLGASGLFPLKIDPQALRHYLQYGFTLQPRTMLAGVRMLEPGVIERHVPGKPVLSQRFWTMPTYEPRKETFEEAAERVHQVVKESTALHAFADAKVGAFLSGGIDSTGIVGMMRKHIPHLKTYTLRYPEFPDWDESAVAAASARELECENTVVDITGTIVRDCLAKFAGDLDQPSSDGLNTWLISRAAARDVKGILSGLGGDEWFSGYPCAQRMRALETRFRGQAAKRLGALARRAEAFLPNDRFAGGLRERIEHLGARRSLLATWVQAHTVFAGWQTARLVGERAWQDMETPISSVIGAGDENESALGLCTRLDVHVYMRCQLLRDSDATSMAHSLELRVPFVDPVLANCARTCRDDYKLSLDRRLSEEGIPFSKRVLRRALRDEVPRRVQTLPKRGFSLPIAHWMTGELREIVEETCSPATVKRRGLLDLAAVSELMAAGRQDPGLQYPKIWSVVILELWCRAVLDVAASSSSASDSLRDSIILLSSDSRCPDTSQDNIVSAAC
jgi:asparagine synthase (glutamine-hydrolysing)